MIPLLAALLPAVGAPMVRMAPARPRAPLLLLVIGLANFVLAGAVALGLAAPGGATFARGYFVVDATSRLFLLLVNSIVLGVVTYVWARVRAVPALKAGVERYAGFCLAFVAACNLAILSNHLVAYWVFLELTTLAAIPLIQHGGGAPAVRASWKYLLFSGVGLGLVLLGLLCLERGLENAGHREVELFVDVLARAAPAAPDAWWRLGLALVFLGLGTKLGLAPMYAWLPDTYDAAPPATTALLAAVQFNVALLGLFRVVQLARHASAAPTGFELIALGLATMVVSSLSTIAATNYKKLIAYASLNHAGVIAVGLGIGREATYGVVVYVVSNAIIKAILFLTAGKIQGYYQTTRMADVSGLIKDLPYSGVFFMVGVFALLGLPPFGSFVGELIIMSGLVGHGMITVFVAFCATLTVNFVATGRAVFPMIWGAPRRKVDWARQPLTPMLPKVFFLSALVAMGLYIPRPINELFRQVAASLGAP